MEITDLMNEARRMVTEIPAESKREIIAKSRWTCDSNWMMALVLTSGWDVANKMNLQVGHAVGKVEMHRLMKLLKLEGPRNDMDFMTLVTLGMETFITKDYFDYEFQFLNPGKMLGIVRQCYAYTKIRSVGAEKNYQCGCFGMRAGWYEAMGVKVKENLVKCLKDGADRCEIMVETVVYPQP